MPATRAPRFTAVSATTLPSAPSAPVMTMTFPFMRNSPRQETQFTLTPEENDLQWPGVWRRNGRATSDSRAGVVHMANTPQACDPHLDLFPYTHPLRHLTESVDRRRR